VTRGGRIKNKDQSERRCIATGDSKPKSEMLRFVVGPERMIVPDIAAKLPGRGIWVSADRAALDKAVGKKLFARAAKQSVELPPELVTLTETLLIQYVVNLISLARKGGLAITGFEKVKEAVTEGSVAVLLQAVDGSAAQKGKIRPPNGTNALISCLYGRELGLAFGRENVIHAALGAGGLTQRIVEEASKLARLRMMGASKQADASGKVPEQEGVKDE